MQLKKYPVGFKLRKENPFHQTRYFKLENLKIPVQTDRGLHSHFTQVLHFYDAFIRPSQSLSPPRTTTIIYVRLSFA